LRVQTPRITTEYRASLAKLAEKTAEQVKKTKERERERETKRERQREKREREFTNLTKK